LHGSDNSGGGHVHFASLFDDPLQRRPDISLTLWKESQRVSVTVDAGPICQPIILSDCSRGTPAMKALSISSRCWWPHTEQFRLCRPRFTTASGLRCCVIALLFHLPSWKPIVCRCHIRPYVSPVVLSKLIGKSGLILQ
jgi:hypothetical protein